MAGEAMTRAFIGLGTNLSDRWANLREALARLGEEEGAVVLALSSVYETAPVGNTNQGLFLNMVAAIETRLAPVELLALCKSIEAGMGRQPGERWGPRVIDLDILLYGDLTIAEADLTIPHPRLLRRAFAVAPLLELEPDLCLPDGRPLAECGPAQRAGQAVELVGPLA